MFSGCKTENDEVAERPKKRNAQVITKWTRNTFQAYSGNVSLVITSALFNSSERPRRTGRGS